MEIANFQVEFSLSEKIFPNMIWQWNDTRLNLLKKQWNFQSKSDPSPQHHRFKERSVRLAGGLKHLETGKQCAHNYY